MPGSVTLDCPAKLNLALEVAPPDPQDPHRLHPIASWMVGLSFADRLTVSRVVEGADESSETTFDFTYAEDAPSPRVIDWPLDRDLVFRAHGLVEKHVGRVLPVRVKLEKRIPTGAGLGGGSSDAAGMIVALDRLFDLALRADDHRVLAAALGSDVHFALGVFSGVTSAIVTGSGDHVEPAPPSLAWPIDVVLVLPEFGCATGPVYAAFDRLAAESLPIDPQRLSGLAEGFCATAAGSAQLFNDLSDAAAEVEPRLRALIVGLRDIAPSPVHVTGSGAASFIIAESPQEAEALATRITSDLQVTAIATRTL